jgi:hypothetical protein
MAAEHFLGVSAKKEGRFSGTLPRLYSLMTGN